MFNSVQYVRALCQQRNLPISQLEKDCGFSNGYLNPKKMTRLPYDRALTIAQYLGVTPEQILTGEAHPAPAAAAVDVLEEVDVAFYGNFKELDEQDQQTVRDMVRIMRERRSRKQE